MDVRPLWGRTPGGGGCSSAGSPCSPADRVFPIHSAPRGSNNCTHRDRTAVDVRPLWGRTREVGVALPRVRHAHPRTGCFRFIRPQGGRTTARTGTARPWTFAPFGDVLGRWGLLFRGFAMLTRGYRVVRPPWGRIPAQPTHRRATGRIPHGLHIVVPWVASRTAGASSCHGPHSARSAHRRVMESHPRTAGTSSCRGSHPHTAGASSCHGSHSARPHRADGPEGVALLCSRG